MFSVIFANNKTIQTGKEFDDISYGIGKDGKIPWKCPEDLELFKKTTMNSILIMGRKTVENLPRLEGRIVFCLSRSGKLERDMNNSRLFPSLDSAFQTCLSEYPEKKIFVAGGKEVYSEAFSRFGNNLIELHISVVNDISECDTFIRYKDYSHLGLSCRKDTFLSDKLHYYVLSKPVGAGEGRYLSLAQKVLQEGEKRICRNGETSSLFGENLTFNLQEGFPLLTTKKMFFRGIVEELLFFVRGDTDTKLLEEKGVNIWKGNTERKFLDSLGKTERPDGIMGPMYGYQWRHFGAKYCQKTGKPLEKGIDQLKNVIDTIRKDPASRRILLTDFNPAQAGEGVLYPCHSIVVQFYVSGEFLDMYCYNRSQDLFLGTPFNIASSALLLTLIAEICNLKPRKLQMGMGDVHIYSGHYEKVEEQIARQPYPFPKIILKKKIHELEDLEKLQSSDIVVHGYYSEPAIKAEMVA